jgi:alpha-L-fucosidase 2
MGTGATAYKVGAPGGHSGPGTVGFTSKLFWDYFEFTRDTSYLLKTGYPALLGGKRQF